MQKPRSLFAATPPRAPAAALLKLPLQPTPPSLNLPPPAPSPTAATPARTPTAKRALPPKRRAAIKQANQPLRRRFPVPMKPGSLSRGILPTRMFDVRRHHARRSPPVADNAIGDQTRVVLADTRMMSSLMLRLSTRRYRWFGMGSCLCCVSIIQLGSYCPGFSISSSSPLSSGPAKRRYPLVLCRLDPHHIDIRLFTNYHVFHETDG